MERRPRPDAAESGPTAPGGFGTIPLFSPGAVSRSGERVLHSIFSPSFRGGGGAVPRLVGPAEEEEEEETADGCDGGGGASPPRAGDNLPIVVNGGERQAEERDSSRRSDRRDGSDAYGSTSKRDERAEQKLVSPELISASGKHLSSLDKGKGRHSACQKNEGILSRQRKEIPRSVTFRFDGAANGKNQFQSPDNGVRDSKEASPSLDLFMSPISALEDEFHSTGSSQTNVSWNHIPLEMLNFEFVSSCESMAQLESVVSALTSEGRPAEYPSLLRLATARLKALRNKSTADTNKQSSKALVEKRSGRTPFKEDTICSGAIERSLGSEGTSFKSAENESFAMRIEKVAGHDSVPEQNIAPRKEFGTDNSRPGKKDAGPVGVTSDNEQESSVLNSSMPMNNEMTEELDEHPGWDNCEGKTADPTVTDECESTYTKHANAKPHQLQHSYDELKENLTSVIAAHSLLSAELDTALREKDSIQSELADQREKCHKLEKKITVQNDRIISLERARNEAEADVATLEETVVDSSAKAREVATQLKARTDEADRLRNELCMERENAAKELVIIKEMRSKIKQLSRELHIQEEKAAEREVELKREFERVSGVQKAKIAELTKHLSESRGDIHKLTRENDELSNAIQKLEKQIYEGKGHNEMAAQAASAELAANAMAKALALSERDLAEAVQGRDKCERDCSKLTKANCCLQKENSCLTENIQSINEELTSSHVYIDKLSDELELLRQKQEKLEEIKEGKEELLCQISHLQSQLKEQESWVSMDQYQEMVRKAKIQADHIFEKESEIKQLSAKNQELEAMMAKRSKQFPSWKKSSDVDRSPDAEGDSDKKHNPRRVTPLSEMFHKKSQPLSEREEEIQSNTQQTSPLDQNISGKSLARISAVRAAGGRAGLTAKLKKTRGSALRTPHQKQYQRFSGEDMGVEKEHINEHQSKEMRSSKTVSWAGHNKENLKVFYR